MGLNMRYFAFLILSVFFIISNVYAQPKSGQSWQQSTIATDSITVSCRPLLLPYEMGRLLFEGNPTTVEGEMDSTLRSAHPVRVLLQPQTGTSDTLSAINGCNVDGAVVQLAMADIGDTVTVANSATIKFADGLPFTISNVYTIVTLIRKGGVWVSAAGASPSGGIEIANNCAHATAFDAVCIDRVQRRIYLGTGTGIVAIGGGGSEGGDGCFGLDDCFDIGPTIDGLNGRTNALRLLDANGDGFLIYVGTSGPVIECVTDFGTVNEAPCTPTAEKSFALYPNNFSPDGTYAQLALSQALNSGRATSAITFADNDASGIEAIIPMPNTWNGLTLRLQGWMHTAEASPDGVIRLDWSGYCVAGTSAGGTGAYAAETSDGIMVFSLNGHAQHRQIEDTTTGNVPLSGCVGTTNRILWLRAMVSAANTTADNLPQQYFFMFTGIYGLRTFE